ncbi:MAG: metalloregulator ArsR/SmtB family transcription factor [Clostridia bacterium]|nr:metalloregulator ArsR/SmtB family transcription factor [Clostridia bacterium]
MDENTRIARLCKALGDPNRVEIIRRLQQGETCACHLLKELAVSQPTLSHHMRILTDAELVTARRGGKWVHYSLNDEGIARNHEMMRALLFTRTSAEAPRTCCGNGETNK